MKKLYIFLILAPFCMAGSIQAQTTLTVVVKNLRSETGNVSVGLFTNEKDFLKNAVEGKVIKASGKEVIVVFENLKKGDYAISVIHDENENGKLDSSVIGIPTEGFAFGNNAMGMFGPPAFDKAKITVHDQPVRQELSLKYM